MSYAVKTDVPAPRTRAEIELLVQKHGATKFSSGWEDGAIAIMFEMRTRRVRFYLPMPQANEKQFAYDGNRKPRTAEGRAKAHDQAIRSRWRALLLVIKAKLEAIESGVTSFDQEFLAHIMLPGGVVVGDVVLEQLTRLEAGASNGEPHVLLLGPGGQL